MNKHLEELSQLKAKGESLKASVVLGISKLPDNPRITRVSGTPQAFVMNFSDISGGIWSPYYHDFKFQYRKIVEIINGCSPENIEKRLRKLISERSCRVPNRDGSGLVWNSTLRFHPDVIDHLSVQTGIVIEKDKKKGKQKRQLDV